MARGSAIMNESDDDLRLVERARGGDDAAAGEALVRAERLLRLQEALNALDPLDREILSLRHFEELTHAEAARVLEIQEAAAAKRYVRALKRLKDVLTAL